MSFGEAVVVSLIGGIVLVSMWFGMDQIYALTFGVVPRITYSGIFTIFVGGALWMWWIKKAE